MFMMIVHVSTCSANKPYKFNKIALHFKPCGYTYKEEISLSHGAIEANSDMHLAKDFHKNCLDAPSRINSMTTVSLSPFSLFSLTLSFSCFPVALFHIFPAWRHITHYRRELRDSLATQLQRCPSG